MRRSVTSSRIIATTQTNPSVGIDAVDRLWRAANYLSAGQIYLRDNPLLRREIEPSDIKPRLLGHWGTTPGINLVYAHLDRLIVEREHVNAARHRTRPRRPSAVRQHLARRFVHPGLPVGAA